ncbi:hypothetical protein DM02DRAFT_663662 [Periconia macrospinosa]|uniref:Uncharacterized protein n=1 Tax=Periconia macrospinosa TaxID=97972 RepID=A0A2V1D2K9_9PLEO|nr:hypothetical protein DM02DRAFT_663662 [Periconia macrospinosa]
MGKNNKVAERAYTVAFQVLRGLASKLDAEISDLIWEDIAHSTAPSLDVRVPNVDSSQQYPIQTMEDEHTGHISMFYTPTMWPSSNAPLTGHNFQTHQLYDSISNNPFMTTYDEENPVTSGERL